MEDGKRLDSYSKSNRIRHHSPAREAAVGRARPGQGEKTLPRNVQGLSRQITAEWLYRAQAESVY